VSPTPPDRFEEERLGELLALLPPAPSGWTRAAQELPAARRELDEIVERARADADFRLRLVADLEQALASGGYVPRVELLAAVRAYLRDPQ